MFYMWENTLGDNHVKTNTLPSGEMQLAEATYHYNFDKEQENT